MKRFVSGLCFIVLATVIAWAQKVEPAFSPENIEFPTVEGWRLGPVNPLPGEDSGIIVNYDSPDRERMSIYVYSRGGKITDELKGVVKDEFEGAKDALKTLVDMGVYSNLKVVKNDTITVASDGKVKALHAAISFDVKDMKLNSEIFVYPYKAHIVKLRISRPASLPPAGPVYVRLLKALDDLFSR